MDGKDLALNAYKRIKWIEKFMLNWSFLGNLYFKGKEERK
jgi:hypothetical protein